MNVRFHHSEKERPELTRMVKFTEAMKIGRRATNVIGGTPRTSRRCAGDF